jgi:hypothetical protein
MWVAILGPEQAMAGAEPGAGDAQPFGILLRRHRLAAAPAPRKRPHGLPRDTGHGPPHNLPAEVSSFVGREQDLERLAASLADARLLTLLGPGGVGKTRLALRLAAGLRGDYPDGVWLVDLAPLTDARLVPSAVVSALRLREAPAGPAVDVLLGGLAARRLLLVLDNCEHLLEACAGLVTALLPGGEPLPPGAGPVPRRRRLDRRGRVPGAAGRGRRPPAPAGRGRPTARRGRGTRRTRRRRARPRAPSCLAPGGRGGPRRTGRVGVRGRLGRGAGRTGRHRLRGHAGSARGSSGRSAHPHSRTGSSTTRSRPDRPQSVLPSRPPRPDRDW